MLELDHHQGIPWQTLYWKVPRYKRGQVAPKTNRRNITKNELTSQQHLFIYKKESKWSTHQLCWGPGLNQV